MGLIDIKIYRITHILNIPHIMRYGITHKTSPHADPHYFAIGDISLINTRNSRQVQVTNGNILTMGTVITYCTRISRRFWML